MSPKCEGPHLAGISSKCSSLDLHLNLTLTSRLGQTQEGTPDPFIPLRNMSTLNKPSFLFSSVNLTFYRLLRMGSCTWLGAQVVTLPKYINSGASALYTRQGIEEKENARLKGLRADWVSANAHTLKTAVAHLQLGFTPSLHSTINSRHL